MNTIIFCLGAGTAIVLVLLVAVVVMVARLNKEVSHHAEILQDIDRRLTSEVDGINRTIGDLENRFERNLGEEVRSLTALITDLNNETSRRFDDVIRNFSYEGEKNLAVSKGYTDSRIDKALVK
jgi:predicted PurR-regulated permease PerM